MDEKFDSLLEEYERLQNTLRRQLPFFADEGNVYLVAENLGKLELVRKEYTKQLKLALKYADSARLNPLYNLLQALGIRLAEAMEFKQSQFFKVEHILAPDNPPTDFAELLQRFVELQQLVQYMFTQLFSYLDDDYSLLQVPPPVVQGVIVAEPELFNFTADQTTLELEVADLLTAGRPDLAKFKALEQKGNYLKIELSVHSELTALQSKLAAELFLEPLSDYTLNGIIDVFTPGYYELFTFLYEQISTIKIPLAEARANAEQKFGKLPIYFSQLLTAAKPQLLQFLETEAERTKIAAELAAVLNFVNTMPEVDFWNWKFPRLYDLELRPGNKFEQEYYQVFFSVDVLFPSEIFATQSGPVASYICTLPDSVYTKAAVTLCGDDYNQKFSEELFFSQGLTWQEKLSAQAAGFKPDPRALAAAETEAAINYFLST